MSMKILVVDDEQNIVTLIKTYLDREGYQVFTADNGRTALELASTERPNLIILDLMLPEISGEEICEYLQHHSSIPIIMLTAKAEEDHKVAGLSLGADDYITKPFSPKELVARVKAVLRRTDYGSHEIVFSSDGSIQLDPRKHLAVLNNHILPLTPTEYKLLHLFVSNSERVFTRTELSERLFGWDYQGYEETIYVHVKNLRQKIRKHSPISYITTVYGVGYRWDDDHAN